MRICFITSSLEPGRDGVGDHTWLLAQECAGAGHAVCAIALNDGHLASASGTVERDGPVLRLAASAPWGARVRQARQFVDAFRPDAFSLQFVCYGFNSRGMPLGLLSRLKRIIRGRPVEVMLHELWIGAEEGAPLKQRIIGGFQRWIVIRLLHGLKAAPIHTSNAAYCALLRQAGFNSDVLPLHGSVPIISSPDTTWLFSRLQEGSVDLGERDDYWLFGLFGTVHPVWPPEPLFTRLAETAAAAGKKIVVCAIGRLGAGRELFLSLGKRYPFPLIELGEQTVERVSGFLQAIDFGIATTPWQLMGKSSTAAAMIAHGLPVVVNRDDVRYPGVPGTAENASPLLIKLDDQFTHRLLEARRGPARSLLPQVATQFLNALQGSLHGR